MNMPIGRRTEASMKLRVGARCTSERAGERGQSLFEFALVLPILMLILLGHDRLRDRHQQLSGVDQWHDGWRASSMRSSAGRTSTRARRLPRRFMPRLTT